MEKLVIMPLLSTMIKNVGFRETFGLSLGDLVALVMFLSQPELCPSSVQHSAPRLTSSVTVSIQLLPRAAPRYIGAALDIQDFLNIFEE